MNAERQEMVGLASLAAVATVAAALAASPELIARLLRLRPLPLHRRIWVELRYRLNR